MKVSWLKFAARPTAHEVVYADRSRREDDEQLQDDRHDTKADRGLDRADRVARHLVPGLSLQSKYRYSFRIQGWPQMGAYDNTNCNLFVICFIGVFLSIFSFYR